MAINNSKFVEINHNEWLIFVRKSTLVWLFQEGERVSANGLFRVCAKQPFSTPIQPIRSQSDFSVPEVREFIELGEFCVFQDVTTKQWSIVKVTQFANFKENLKSNRQFKATKASVHSDAVGALCSWFVNEDKSREFNYNNDRLIDYVPISKSYICTLSLNCFEETKATDIKSSSIANIPNISCLQTCSQVVLREDALKYISKLLV